MTEIKAVRIGTAEIPVEQILTYEKYEPEILAKPHEGQKAGERKAIKISPEQFFEEGINSPDYFITYNEPGKGVVKSAISGVLHRAAKAEEKIEQPEAPSQELETRWGKYIDQAMKQRGVENLSSEDRSFILNELESFGANADAAKKGLLHVFHDRTAAFLKSNVLSCSTVAVLATATALAFPVVVSSVTAVTAFAGISAMTNLGLHAGLSRVASQLSPSQETHLTTHAARLLEKRTSTPKNDASLSA